MIAAGGFSRILAMLVVGVASNALAAEEGAWSVSKSSGEVWMITTGAQPVSLGKQEVLKPSDSIRTGRNGRVLLVRGEETILVSPNSVIGLPAEKKDGLSTTIVQGAGSILLEVEKRNVKHFEVETPYLAAVVKGTQFRVSVNATSTSVDVIKGQVQVADFRSGQIAQVLPGQHATAFAQGNSGLSLGGSGTFSPIERGQPRAPSIDRVPVPKSGLTAPRHAANGPAIRAIGQSNPATGAKPGSASLQPQRNTAAAATRHSPTRISSSLGEVRLNIHRVTDGLARGSAQAHGATRNVASRDTIWGPRNSAATAIANGSSNAGDASNGNAGAVAASSAAAASGAAGAIAAAASPMGGNGNGNSGNGNNGNGNSGNGNGGNGDNGNGDNGNGNNGNNGNGNGANGNGNGSNGHGHGRGHR